ncbi:Mini-ribonuclease 3 [Virgibacillus soli]|uniref:Mini-ribonuclease 3 n=1 Tax=Paracerasibacillus soli TaxID=480284 RepID=A0ABU5CUH9_9BACI|nr:Mini-ribonuclease 3 [Virgibacillus soli]MDY0410027.1 Mini-ribonuclease 3 [Virgibacillus soli]
MSEDIRQMKSLALAYMGDAVYEVFVREHVLHSGQVKPNQLHRKTVTFVSANAQAKIIKAWLQNGKLSDEETQIVQRGRNAKSGSIPKNASVQAYRYSTAFETLIGYLFLAKEEERLSELLTEAVAFIERENDNEGRRSSNNE